MDADLIVPTRSIDFSGDLGDYDNHAIHVAPRQLLESALTSAMERAGHQVMTWGIDDCARWCTGVLKAALGYDASAPWGRYDSRDAAAAALGPLGLGFAMRAAARTHGWRRIDPKDAQLGDLGLALLPAPAEGPPQIVNRGTVLERATYPAALQPSMMICRAPGWFVGRSETGFISLDIRRDREARLVRLAWSVVP